MLDVWDTVVESSAVPGGNLNGIRWQLREERHRIDGGWSIGTIFPDIHKVGCRVRREHGFVETGFGNFNFNRLWTNVSHL